MKKLKIFIGLLLGVLVPSIVLAWDGTVQGMVSQYHVVPGDLNNFEFRIYLNGISNAMCTGGQNWAYVNTTDSNYNATVAAVMAAKAGGNSIVMYTRTVNGYCHIGYLVVQ